jgi:D-sedoheptulose 7-phosphate isomerase
LTGRGAGWFDWHQDSMSKLETAVQNAYRDAAIVLQEFTSSDDASQKTLDGIHIVTEALSGGGKIIVCGNGGSACDALHFCEELTGRFRNDRKPLPAIALTDPAHVTAVGNDYGFSEVFSRGVQAYGKKDDVLIGISTSGNSENVIRAVAAAKEIEMKTILLLGKGGGKLRGVGDVNVIVNASTSDRVQEVHMTFLHVLIEGMERIMFPLNYQETLEKEHE